MNNAINYEMIARQMMKNPNLANNPMALNALKMCEEGNSQGINELFGNICNEKGIDKNNININGILNKILGMN